VSDAILIVEDSSDDAEWLAKMLNLTGICNPVRCVSGGVEALAYLRGDHPYSDRARFPNPGIVFLDLKLPDTEEFEVLRTIKGTSEWKKLLVIALSGLDDLKTIRRAYDLGANTFLVKPCNLADIENLIRWFPEPWEFSKTTKTAAATVLVIDDEDSMLLAMERILSMAGYKVLCASNGDEGLNKFRQHSADVVVTDIFMPVKEGIETISELRKEFSTVPIIAMSGNPFSESGFVAAKAVGATHVLPKPFRSDELLRTVSEALQSRPD
jgi:DNA-binding response OmpR family regulator